MRMLYLTPVLFGRQGQVLAQRSEGDHEHEIFATARWQAAVSVFDLLQVVPCNRIHAAVYFSCVLRFPTLRVCTLQPGIEQKIRDSFS